MSDNQSELRDDKLVVIEDLIIMQSLNPTEKRHKDIMALIEAREIAARRDEIDSAIKQTQQLFHTSSPFTNITNIDNQVIAATSNYLLNRIVQLTHPSTKEEVTNE